MYVYTHKGTSTHTCTYNHYWLCFLTWQENGKLIKLHDRKRCMVLWQSGRAADEFHSLKYHYNKMFKHNKWRLHSLDAHKITLVQIFPPRLRQHCPLTEVSISAFAPHDPLPNATKAIEKIRYIIWLYRLICLKSSNGSLLLKIETKSPVVYKVLQAGHFLSSLTSLLQPSLPLTLCSSHLCHLAVSLRHISRKIS